LAIATSYLTIWIVSDFFRFVNKILQIFRKLAVIKSERALPPFQIMIAENPKIEPFSLADTPKFEYNIYTLLSLFYVRVTGFRGSYIFFALDSEKIVITWRRFAIRQIPFFSFQ